MLTGFVKKGQTLFILSFLVPVLFGALLLVLPFAVPGGMSWTDAVFMSTSAVCVTGLSTVPVGDMSFAGQVVLLFLLQLGGVGMMSMSASILLLLGHGLSFSDTLLISNLNDNFSLRRIDGLVRTVGFYTLSCETVGFLLLAPAFLCSGYPVAKSLWYALFHAVAAFCNAGLTPLAESMRGQSVWIQTVITLLAASGGLGVYVIYDLVSAVRNRRLVLRVHSKLVLITTLVLIAAGTLVVWSFGFEDGGTIGFGDALFQVANGRTAGFSNLDLKALPVPSLIVFTALMLIGGSPGSTAGGMKTSTVALAFCALLNVCRGNYDTILFKRRIPIENILRSFTIIVVFLLALFAGAVILHCLQGITGTPLSIGGSVFEVASALSTAGASVGVTALLNPWSKLFMAAVMFIGRIGPFTLMLALMEHEKPPRRRYPDEKVLIS